MPNSLLNKRWFSQAREGDGPSLKQPCAACVWQSRGGADSVMGLRLRLPRAGRPAGVSAMAGS
jgi:hypothetical protein